MPEPEQATPIRDVAVMRALAHPARLALLDRLTHDGPATATECAEVVGLSPSAVSYHLRSLAKAGLVEEAPGRGDGRERVWRNAFERLQVNGPVAGPGPAGREATRALAESLLALDEARTRRYLDRAETESPEWLDAAFLLDSTLLVTAEELRGLSAAVLELLAPYRKASRADAPAGARSVSAVFKALPL